jgi:tRNA threonylcarbamoyladenosine biosynthesis protein TsaB
MLTLAVECATKTVSLALLDDREVCAELYVNLGRHHAEMLLPALDHLLRLAGRSPNHLDLLACTVGPGSFTGLRIGASTVKGLFLALDKPVVGVSTLEVLAMNAMPTSHRVCPLLDARHEQVYAGLYRMGSEGLPEKIGNEKLIDIKSFLNELVGEEIVFVGDGAVRHEKLVTGMLGTKALFAGPDRQNPRAGALGRIALQRYQAGEILDTLRFAPRYLRPSEAEVKSGMGQATRTRDRD